VTTAVVDRSRFLAFVVLMKPRIIELLLVSTVPTMFLAQEGLPSFWLMTATVIGGTLSAGGASVFNMYIDRDIDALMTRTKNRPLVTGEVEPNEALIFAAVLEILSFVWLWAFVNLLSAVLAVAACAFYVVIYTMWLKRTSTQNIVVGGAAGAAPVLIGWSAVTNTISLEAFLLFGVVFFWTPPHFWALAIRYQEDYAAANIPMLPVVDGNHKTAKQMVVYSLIVWAITLVLWPVSALGYIYLATAVVVGVLFTGGAVQILRETDPERQSKLGIRYFGFSITHLTLLFAAVAVDQLVGWGVG
jgi:protoheme IX farnesyltransferase